MALTIWAQLLINIGMLGITFKHIIEENSYEFFFIGIIFNILYNKYIRNKCLERCELMDYLEGLNDRQREAVLHIDGPLLILAGAGSGKTRVITHKIAYLIEEKRIFPGNILAITFTNKAANEMKERVAKLLSNSVDDMWMGTFHSI